MVSILTENIRSSELERATEVIPSTSSTGTSLLKIILLEWNYCYNAL